MKENLQENDERRNPPPPKPTDPPYPGAVGEWIWNGNKWVWVPATLRNAED